MAEIYREGDAMSMKPSFDKNLERIDEDLNIMEKHAAELADAEDSIQESMKKRDREYKDARLHSTPRPRKHMR